MSKLRRVIAAGAGHAHLHLAANADEFRKRGAELVLIDPGRFWYSGLATGMLGGSYQPEEDTIVPRRLVEQCGGRFIQDRLVGLDRQHRDVHLAGGQTLDYDLLSLNLGSEVKAGAINGAEAAAGAWTVKPIHNLKALRQNLHQRFDDRREPPLRIVVIGGGATGPEVMANLVGLARRHEANINATLLTRSNRLLKQAPARASACLQASLEQRGVRVRLATSAKHIQDGHVALEGGEAVSYDVLVLATGLRPPRMLKQLGLPLGDEDGLQVNAALQSVEDEVIFGTGDCIDFEPRALPKLGVFGVREAPILLHNLLASLDGRPLKPYEPQKKWLYILNLGDGTGLAVRGRWWQHGRWCLWWKDHLDRKFLRQYRTLRGG